MNIIFKYRVYKKNKRRGKNVYLNILTIVIVGM